MRNASKQRQKQERKPIYDWGQTSPPAPSIQRVEPWGWVCASALGGAAVGLLALKLQWRPFPGLPMPPGGMGEHLAYWAELACHWAWPRAFPKDAAFYAGFIDRLPWAEKAGLAGRAALAACAAAAPAFLLAKPFLRPRDGLIFLRGSRRREGMDATLSLMASLRARALRRPDHEIAPGVVYPSDMWTRHVLVVGGVGSGKSTAIKPLIDKVVAAGEQMLLFDPKSEFTVGFGAPALVAPWDARSLAWDVAKDMRNVLDMRRFAATMIRDSTDPMWSNASRQLLVGLLIHLKATRGDAWGWLDLKRLVALPQAELLPIMVEWHPEAVRAVEKASVTTAGILINLSAFCSSIFDLAEAWGAVPENRRISFVDWTLGRSKFPQVILQGHGAYSELTKSYVEGIVGIVSAIVNSVEMRDDHSRKIWFVADEFAQMGKVPVRALFEVGRSRGVRCVVACQDLAQLEEIYGASMVKALISMCGTLLVGQVMPGETADQLCKAFGGREVERENVSSATGGSGRSTTTSYNREEVALYKPAELASRLGLTPDGAGVVLILYAGGEAYELFFPHYQIREEREAHVPAPWTQGIGGSRSEALGRLAHARAAEAEKANAADGQPMPEVAAPTSVLPKPDGLSAEHASLAEQAISGSSTYGAASGDEQAVSDFHRLVGVAEGRRSGESPPVDDRNAVEAISAISATSAMSAISAGSNTDIGRRPRAGMGGAWLAGRAELLERARDGMAEEESDFDLVDREEAEILSELGEGDPLGEAILESAIHHAGLDALSAVMLMAHAAEAFVDGSATRRSPPSASRASGRGSGEFNASAIGELSHHRVEPQPRKERGRV